jgi:hypothetical protein
MMIVITIIAVLRVSLFYLSRHGSARRETVLRDNLRKLRKVIDQYTKRHPSPCRTWLTPDISASFLKTR